MNLSTHFTLDDLTHSDTAKREGIPNLPTETEIGSLRALCEAILEPLRAAIGGAIKINSGYRGPQLNTRIKGAKKSQHLNGEAADIQAPGLTVMQLFKTIIKLGLPFDQVIYEAKSPTSKWVHVSHSAAGNRGQIMVAQFDAAGNAVAYPTQTAEQALAIPEPVSRSRGPVALPNYVEGDDEPPEAKPPVKKAPAKKAAVKKAPAAKKTPATKKAPAKKAPAAKKVAAKKAPAKKAAAKKKPAR
jgi:zinc D-Ala-D-Ala carboxypeptidase